MTNELGETIRQTRKQMKLTLRELGERSGLTVSQLSKLENGKQRIHGRGGLSGARHFGCLRW